MGVGRFLRSGGALLLVSLLIVSGCTCEATTTTSSPSSSVSVGARVRGIAPEFTAKAVSKSGEITTISLASYRGGYTVLVFYPLDFTFVCPTELIAFSDAIPRFESMGARVLGISTDSEYSHLAWTKKSRQEGGLGALQFPLVSDFTKSISRSYGVLLEEDGVALRALVIIDPQGVIRHISTNDLPVGRNVDEVLRLVSAFKFTDEHGEVCPANWKPGQKTIIADPVQSKEYFQSVYSNSEL